MGRGDVRNQQAVPGGGEVSARPSPREIADNAGSRHRMLDELAHYGYRIVHPDDTPPWKDRNDWTEGWNDCRSAIFDDQCRAPESV